MKENEILLIKRAKEGETGAFGELVSLYEKQVYNIALRFSSNPDDACDISQNAFLRAFRYIKTFKEESAFSTWLYRIVINCCNDYIKKSKKQSAVPLYYKNEYGEDEELKIPDLSYNPEEIFEREQIRDLVRDAIDILPIEFRQVIILRDINGLSYDEIAEILNLEIGTVKSRIFRGRKKIELYIIKQGNYFYKDKSNKLKGGGKQ